MINRYTKSFLIFVLILLIKKCFSNDAHTNLISILEFNYPIEFTFEQKYKGEKLYGWMVIMGNGRARTEFEPPNNKLIVADGNWIMFYDPEIDRTTYIPIDKGIFKAFLKPEELAEPKVFEIKETEDKGKIKFIINFNLNNAQKIIIYFDRVSKNLLGWRLYESLNDFIEVKVVNYRKFTTDNKSLLKKIFKLTEAKSKTGMEYFSPYDNRQVKKVTKGGRLN